MSDLVERLRKPSGIGEPMDHMAMEEAADEIERLRAALEGAAQLAFDQTSDDPIPGDWNDACEHIGRLLRDKALGEPKP